MRLVEQHRIDRHDARFAAIDAAIDAADFASKRLSNTALSLTRQAFLHEGRVVSYEDLARALKTSVKVVNRPESLAEEGEGAPG